MRHFKLLRWTSLPATALFILAACTASFPTTATSTPPPNLGDGSSPTITSAPVPTSVSATPPAATQSQLATATPGPATLPPEPTSTATAVPPVVYFTVTPTTSLTVGAKLSLAWKAVGEQASLCFIAGQPTGCQDVPLKGSMTVTITEDMLASSGVGLRVTTGAEVAWSIVDLRFQCNVDWFFEAPPSRCPAQTPVYSRGAAQYFEHGFMVWTETPDTFYVFFDQDQEFIFLLGPYSFVSPEPVSATPPAGFYEPTSGFGQLWRGELAGVNAADIRSRLGWATAAEFGYDTAYQCELAAYARLWTCYLRGPDGGVLRLHPDSSAQARFLWERW